MLINVTQALGEMAIVFPISGGFYTLASRMLDPSFAFAMGWNYVLQWAVVLPLELVVAGQVVQWWDTPVPLGVWITIFFLLIVGLSILGTLGFAEEEFWSSALKLSVVIIFVITGIVCITGGGPSDGAYSSYLGGYHWKEPGAFANGFKGVCAVFVSAAFSFAGTELVGLAATETPNPRKSLPAAVKQTFWRVTLVYITSLTIIGLAIPYTNGDLQGAGGGDVSPFVLVMELGGIKGLPHLINITICISVLSIAMSCVYAGSRTLTALAETNYAPKFFTYIDKAGRPLWSVIFILAFSPLAYLQLIPETGGEIFDWLLALSGLSTLFSWLAICVTHIRFRRAWKVQGHSVEELPFQALGGIYGSILGTTLIVLVLIAQFFIAVWPLNYSEVENRAEEFFSESHETETDTIWSMLTLQSLTLPPPLCSASGSSASGGSAHFPVAPTRSTLTLVASRGSRSRRCAPTVPSAPRPTSLSASSAPCSLPAKGVGQAKEGEDKKREERWRKRNCAAALIVEITSIAV
jgi:amino acid transporter